MGVTEIYDGQLLDANPLTGDYSFDFDNQKSDKVIGYAAYFRLSNGFEKTEYWTIAKVEKHARKYSKTYAKNFGKWVDDFDAMAKKTVIKSLLSKWGVLSIEMQRAIKTDQTVVHDLDGEELSYSDNEPEALSIPAETKTLPEAMAEFNAVNSRASFAEAQKNNREFMSNPDIINKCKELAVSYPAPDKK
jgi:recombination protein RecT